MKHYCTFKNDVCYILHKSSFKIFHDDAGVILLYFHPPFPFSVFTFCIFFIFMFCVTPAAAFLREWLRSDGDEGIKQMRRPFYVGIWKFQTRFAVRLKRNCFVPVQQPTGHEIVPRTHNNFSDKSFTVAGPRVWTRAGKKTKFLSKSFRFSVFLGF